ncbi:hypothetical protein V9T40_007644 [Parthenolecanium corni]|uniref:Uncharacterized protein n=1 Tax=Parthenolecanium corni TaxID=536013 RepID=A0AAN9TJP1_9HEMI
MADGWKRKATIAAKKERITSAGKIKSEKEREREREIEQSMKEKMKNGNRRGFIPSIFELEFVQTNSNTTATMKSFFNPSALFADALPQSVVAIQGCSIRGCNIRLADIESGQTIEPIKQADMRATGQSL